MADVVCSPNAVIAFNYFIGKGLRDYQAAAIVGNLQWESHLNPRVERMDINDKMSRGIAQWQPPRWGDLLAFARSNNRDPWSLNTQLAFVWHELPVHGLNELRSASTLDEAVVVFQDRFERPRRDFAHTDGRIKAARAALISCPRVNPPPKPQSNVKTIAAAVVGGAFAALAGFGIYKMQQKREPERRTPPPRPQPPLRPRPAPPDRPRPFPITRPPSGPPPSTTFRTPKP